MGIPKPFQRPSVSIEAPPVHREWKMIPPYRLDKGDIVAEKGAVESIAVYVERVSRQDYGRFVVNVTFVSGTVEDYNGLWEDVFAFTAGTGPDPALAEEADKIRETVRG